MKNKRVDIRITSEQDRFIRDNGISKTKLFEIALQIAEFCGGGQEFTVTAKNGRTITLTIEGNYGKHIQHD